MSLRLEEAFATFNAENPHVYERLVTLAKRYQRAGRKVGIAHLFEIVRWLEFVETRRKDEFKLNNNLRAYYARYIMRTEPTLAGYFDTRTLRAR